MIYRNKIFLKGCPQKSTALRLGFCHNKLMRILIIEDDQEILKSIRHSLEAESFVIDTATNGERGSYAARTNEYDLVILDFMLPKKDGPTICREIRQSGKHMPILMLSVVSSSDKKASLLNSGADDYLTKPFSF